MREIGPGLVSGSPLSLPAGVAAPAGHVVLGSAKQPMKLAVLVYQTQ